MTVAIVHDFLTQRGGAERVVLHLASLVEDPVIVTSSYAPASTYPEFRKLPVWADNLVADRDAGQFRRRAFSYAKSFRAKDLSFADAVIVSTSSFAHHVPCENALVIWYTPPRFLYDPMAYFKSPVVAKSFQLATTAYRIRDRKAATAHQKHLAVSARTAGRLHESYGIEPDVLYPPFDSGHFFGPVAPLPSTPRALVVSRLLPYKRVDLAIEACELVGIPLTIIGQGPDEDRLRELAGSTVTFVPEVSEEELLAAYDGHSLVLSPGIEDFGYIPLESAARGRPVVGAGEGGATETVIDDVTGFLVPNGSPTAWAQAIRRTLSTEWQLPAMRQAVSRFDAAHFDQGLIRAMCAGGDDDLIKCFTPAAQMAYKARPAGQVPGEESPAADEPVMPAVY
jgi:glycosyltransferase involved in cell wall biosynthesis